MSTARSRTAASPIAIDKAERQRLISSIRRYMDENFESIGDLKAGELLDFMVTELGPAIYNQAVTDAQARILHHVTDLPAEVYAPETDYWRDRARK
jgi:uncharacterized protein (DUF2164 family)